MNSTQNKTNFQVLEKKKKEKQTMDVSCGKENQREEQEDESFWWWDGIRILLLGIGKLNTLTEV